jgi:hypothetical protein
MEQLWGTEEKPKRSEESKQYCELMLLHRKEAGTNMWSVVGLHFWEGWVSKYQLCKLSQVFLPDFNIVPY